MNFLEFEKPIAELFEQLEEARQLAQKSEIDMSKAIGDIEKKIDKARLEIYKNLLMNQRLLNLHIHN